MSRPGDRVPRAGAAAILLWAAGCAGPAALPPETELDAWAAEALAAAARHPIGKDEPVKRTILHDSPDRTVLLVQVNGSEAPHIHARYDKVARILSGGGMLIVENQFRTMEPGDVARIPRGAAHAFSNRGPDPTAVLLVTTPRFDPADRQEAAGKR